VLYVQFSRPKLLVVQVSECITRKETKVESKEANDSDSLQEVKEIWMMW
jgi:hypothetical protein